MSQYKIKYNNFNGGGIKYTDHEKKIYNKLYDNIYDVLDQCRIYRLTNIPNQILQDIFYLEGYVKYPLYDAYMHNGSSPQRFSRSIVEMFLKEAGYRKNGFMWIKTFY